MVSAPDPLVFAERAMFAGAPVLTVFHEADGDWQYLTSQDPAPEDAQLVHQSHVYEVDPSLRSLHSLPAGTWATRSAPEQEWVYGEEEPAN